MITIYHKVIEELSKEDYDIESLFELLNKITFCDNHPNLFGELQFADEFTDAEKRLILLYLVYAFTLESEYIVYGAETLRMKQAIAEKIGMPEYLHGRVLLLGSGIVRNVIDGYLDFQGDRDYKHLENKKSVYEKLQRASVDDVTDDKGATNYKLLLELQELSDRLLNEIINLEDRLLQKYNFVFKNKDEINKANVSHGAPPASLNMEDSPVVRGQKNKFP